jgi:hypothetical protein
MPMNSKNSRPLATTPTMPSAIAAITRSRKEGNHLMLRSVVEGQRRASCRQPVKQRRADLMQRGERQLHL